MTPLACYANSIFNACLESRLFLRRILGISLGHGRPNFAQSDSPPNAFPIHSVITSSYVTEDKDLMVLIAKRYESLLFSIF